MTDNNRHIPLDGASNFRDFGGYPTPGGRVKLGHLFRSDRLSRLTVQDFTRLEPLGIRLIVDLRRSSERADEPTLWQGANVPANWHTPVFQDDGTPTSLINIAADPNTRTADAAAEMMRAVYRRLVHESGPQRYFAEVLTRLCNEDDATPMVVHCSGGKDRTGVIVALIQTALDVHWDDILEDFMLTERYYDGTHLMQERAAQILDTHGVEMGNDALAPVFGVHPSYLEAAREEAEERYGSLLGLLDHLGIDGSARLRLAERFIE